VTVRPADDDRCQPRCGARADRGGAERPAAAPATSSSSGSPRPTRPRSAGRPSRPGSTDLGENRVQELLAKHPHVPGVRWHLIGQLQRNKVKDVVGRHVLVHSLDRRSLADALSRRAAAAGVVQRVLVQVNVGDDPAKGGCTSTTPSTSSPTLATCPTWPSRG
jgi:uncharacterized pyridoxal phosphate-containing UPF0001 family protein